VIETGDILRGLLIFNVPVGEERYGAAVLRYKAQQVGQVARQYVEDLEEEYPQELWTMLQFSLHHMITYWLRTCTPEETEQMADHIDCCIMEAVQAATGVDFNGEEGARERLRIPTRMEGGGIRRATETRYPAFLGVLLDVLPRCIDRTEDNGESIYPWILYAATEGGDWGRNIRQRKTQECSILERDGLGTIPGRMHEGMDNNEG